MNYLQQQLLSEGFKIQEETTILTEAEEKEVRKVEIKKAQDIEKIKDPKTKRKLAARLIGAISLAAGIPTAKAASMLAKNSDAARDLFTAQTTINLSDKAVRELSKNENLKNSITKLGVRGARRTAEGMRDYSDFTHDGFAMWTSGLIGKLASSLLRIKNFFTAGDGSAIYSLGEVLGEGFDDCLTLKMVQPNIFEFKDEDGAHMATLTKEIPTNRPFKKTNKFAYINKQKYDLYNYNRHYKLVKSSMLNEELLEESFKETFKTKILPILQITGILGTMFGTCGALGYGAYKSAVQLKNQIKDIVYNDNSYKFKIADKNASYDADKGVLTVANKTVKVPEKQKQWFDDFPDDADTTIEFSDEKVGSDTLQRLKPATLDPTGRLRNIKEEVNYFNY